MPSDTAPTRPAAPPPARRPAALTRHQVLAAALQIIDEDVEYLDALERGEERPKLPPCSVNPPLPPMLPA